VTPCAEETVLAYIVHLYTTSCCTKIHYKDTYTYTAPPRNKLLPLQMRDAGARAGKGKPPESILAGRQRGPQIHRTQSIPTVTQATVIGQSAANVCCIETGFYSMKKWWLRFFFCWAVRLPLVSRIAGGQGAGGEADEAVSRAWPSETPSASDALTASSAI
jgi:hypothetical protein